MLSEVPVLETPCSRTVFGSGGAAATGLKNKTFRESLCQRLCVFGMAGRLFRCPRFGSYFLQCSIGSATFSSSLHPLGASCPFVFFDIQICGADFSCVFDFDC